MTAVFAHVDWRAADIISEIVKPERSDILLVQAIVDKKLGIVGAGTSRPQGFQDECVLRVDTDNPERALQVLPTLPGVQLVAPNYQAIANTFEKYTPR